MKYLKITEDRDEHNKLTAFHVRVLEANGRYMVNIYQRVGVWAIEVEHYFRNAQCIPVELRKRTFIISEYDATYNIDLLRHWFYLDKLADLAGGLIEYYLAQETYR